MSLSLWLDLMGAKWHGRQDAQSALPDQPGPNPYYEYLARKGHRRAGAIHRRFLKLDLRNQHRLIQAETAQRQAQVELPRLQAEADQHKQAYELERAHDQEEARGLNPPGRAYIPVVLYWLLLALLIAGDAAISYSAFLTLGDLMPWLVAALALMVVVAMVVLGHVIGDRFRHGHGGRWGKAGLMLTVVAISLVMTLFREQAQQAAAEATRSVEIGTIIIDGPAATAPVAMAGPAALESISAFLMFLIITMMGIVVPAILAYYVERRPRLLKVVQVHWQHRRARARLIGGQRRLSRAGRRVAAARAERISRHAQAQVRLDESRDDIFWLMSAYAQANMRRRGSQELPASLQERPAVPGREILAELDWKEQVG